MSMIPKQIETELITIVKEAGSLLLSYWGVPLAKNKKSEGFVTEADIAVEQFLMNALRDLFPAADFWAEESGTSGSNNNGYQWIIDPIDGTRNFTHCIPYFCISVALTYYNKPVHAVIYNPIKNELFYAADGQGAYCNELPITVSGSTLLEHSFIAFGLPYAREQRYAVVNIAQKVAAQAGAVRHMGAVALDMANMAMGRFDGLLFTHLSWWDVAAGMLLVKEAGGCVTDLQGQTIDPSYAGCIAGNPLLYTQLYQLIHDDAI